MIWQQDAGMPALHEEGFLATLGMTCFVLLPLQGSQTRRGTIHRAPTDAGVREGLTFGEIFDVFGELFDFVGFFDEIDGKDRGSVGDAELFLEVVNERIHFVDVGANFLLVLFFDGFLVGLGRAAAVQALRIGGIGRVGRRYRLRRGVRALRRSSEEPGGNRKKRKRRSNRPKELAASVEHRTLPKKINGRAGNRAGYGGARGGGSKGRGKI